MNIETARQNMTVIGKVIEQLDSLANNIASARFQFEMISRMPELGETKQGAVTSDQMLGSINHLVEQRDAAENTLLSLTGAETVSEARHLFLRLATAYQKYGTLAEAKALIDTGYSDTLFLDETTVASLLAGFTDLPGSPIDRINAAFDTAVSRVLLAAPTLPAAQPTRILTPGRSINLK